jgi:GxxExxY protein
LNADLKPARDPETYEVVGAAMEVHRVLGRGFLEAVYQAAFAAELARRSITFAEQVELPINYKGQKLRTNYRIDFLIGADIVVEVKALDELTGRERSQLLNYLKASGHRRGLLLNFGARSLQYERMVWG